MHDPLLWDDARVFLAIARSGTLSGAAHALRMGVATVSRRRTGWRRPSACPCSAATSRAIA